MRLEDLANKISDIPTLPMVAQEINAASMKDVFTSQTLGKIISKDPPLTGKMLKVANSAYYGFVRKVTTLERAVTMLGFNTVRSMALTISVSKFFSEGKSGVDMKGLWLHSLGCAVAAKTLMDMNDPKLTEEAFLCGIIHDLGAIILLNNFPDKVIESFEMMRERNISQSDAEKEVLGLTHAEVGAFLADKWNFPEKYYRVIRLHHKPPVETMDPADKDNLLLLTVYAGNQLAKVNGLGKSLDPQSSGVRPEAWKKLGLSLKELPALRTAIKENFEKAVVSWNE